MQDVRVFHEDGTVFNVGLIDSDFPAQKIGNKPVLVNVYDSRYLDYVVYWIKDRIRNGFDCIILYTGERRIGKSTTACSIARRIDPEFSPSMVAFRIGEFNQIVATNPRADPENDVWPQAKLDEAGYDAYAKNWMKDVQKNLVRKFEVIGEKRQIVHLVLPHKDMLLKDFRDDMAKLWVNCETYHGLRGFAIIREAKPNPWSMNLFWWPWAAICTDPFPEDDPFWQAYMIKKRQFVDEVAAESLESTGIKASYSKALAQRNRAISVLQKRTGLTHAEIAGELDMNRKTITRVINRDS